MDWTIAGAIFGAVAAIGVTIQLTIAALSRKHGLLGVSVSEVPSATPASRSYLIALRPMGSLVCSDLKVTGNPMISIDVEAPVAHLDSNSEPVRRVVTFPAERLPGHDYEPRIVCAWTSQTGFRPRPRGLLVLPESVRVFDMRRSAIFWGHHFWKARKPVRHPSVIHVTAGTAQPIRAAGYFSPDPWLKD